MMERIAFISFINERKTKNGQQCNKQDRSISYNFVRKFHVKHMTVHHRLKENGLKFLKIKRT